MKPMRINKFVALSSTMSRRAADRAVQMGRVHINGVQATTGSVISPSDQVSLDGKPLTAPNSFQTVLFNKPVGYVCSKRGQGNKTIYDVLPEAMRTLNPIGRLDKDTSGLLLLTNDGELAQKLSHPSNAKDKVYEIKLDKVLTPGDLAQITKKGVLLGDGLSKFKLEATGTKGYEWILTMHEGRNRQIRRTFQALDYKVARLHRTSFGDYTLDAIVPGSYKEINDSLQYNI